MRRHDDRRGREFPPRWFNTVMLLVAIACIIWTLWSINMSKQEADEATTSANALADQVATACEDGAVKVDGRDICTKAQQVKKNVDEPEAGPAGPRGRQGVPGPRSTVPGPAGEPGEDGQDSEVPGPTGETGEPGDQGAPGEDSEIPGPVGEPGKPGVPGEDGSTVVGPPGAKGEKGEKGDKGESVTGPPGPRGDKGEKGSAGRGISDVTCTADGDWLFEFTDGTDVTVAGPCRAQSAPTSNPTTAP
ncbi:collagen-like protein [Brevibacterium aurantiacum]|uniref:Collagen-like protein n=1 Tax=Brevibacterium aurantiacum TaxID=273384 RepID=A0A556C4P0_BREAU|nr:collagen-like protein [Brevibacterium aurantiacum]TSI11978.1 collagen-like protein [Brevibacterium aurantiacum]